MNRLWPHCCPVPFGLLTFALTVAPVVLLAQEDPEAPTSLAAVQQLANQAYAQTKAAQTASEFTQIIELCEQIQAAENAPGAFRDYANELKSWALNKRGEDYASRAASLAGEGRSEQASDLDQKAMVDFQAAVDLDSSRWKAIHNRGVSYAMRGDFQEALEDFSRVVELRPGYANAWFNRGEVRYELGQYQQAINDYNQSLRLAPDDAGAYTSRAHAHFQVKDMRQALADYNQAVQLDPDNPVYYVNRGDCYQSLSYWENAADDYRRAIRLARDFGRALQGAAWLMATCPQARYRNTELAVQSAERAVELDGEGDFHYLDTLAAAYANAGRYDEAQVAIAKAIAAAPEAEQPRLLARQQLYANKRPYRQGE